MFKLLEPYLLSFIPIFVAIDALGSVPVYLSLVEDIDKEERRRIVTNAVQTATAVAIIFMVLGNAILKLLGITITDFQIAGGLLLFIISVRFLYPGATKTVISSSYDKDIGVFPLGTPLITGPAVLATTLMMLNNFGLAPTFVSLVLNMFIVWATFFKADLIMKFIGPSGTRAFSKIMYILLAAIGVMMVRRGITTAFLQ